MLATSRNDLGVQKVSLGAVPADDASGLALVGRVPTRSLQLLSGHRSLEQLQRYMDVSDERKREAANACG